MKTIFLKDMQLPPFLPQGWKKEVAKCIGVHPNTITNALKAGKGPAYEKILKTATEKYGTGKEVKA